MVQIGDSADCHSPINKDSVTQRVCVTIETSSERRQKPSVTTVSFNPQIGFLHDFVFNSRSLLFPIRVFFFIIIIITKSCWTSNLMPSDDT